MHNHIPYLTLAITAQANSYIEKEKRFWLWVLWLENVEVGISFQHSHRSCFFRSTAKYAYSFRLFRFSQLYISSYNWENWWDTTFMLQNKNIRHKIFYRISSSVQLLLKMPKNVNKVLNKKQTSTGKSFMFIHFCFYWFHFFLLSSKRAKLTTIYWNKH